MLHAPFQTMFVFNLFRSGVYSEIMGYTMMGMKRTNHTFDFTVTCNECEAQGYVLKLIISASNSFATKYCTALNICAFKDLCTVIISALTTPCQIKLERRFIFWSHKYTLHYYMVIKKLNDLHPAVMAY